MGPNIKWGTVTGTGAAVNVSIGFEPIFVLVGNITEFDQVNGILAALLVGAAIKLKLMGGVQ